MFSSANRIGFCNITYRIFLIFVFSFCVLQINAQKEQTDSVLYLSGINQPNDYHFSAKQLIAPVSLIAVGSACVKNHIIDTSNPRERKYYFDDQIQYIPVIAYIGLGFIPGIKHKNNFGERMLAGGTSYIVLTALTQGLKNIVHEPRPDTGTRNSFPSGHTATAFCGAELTRIEYGDIIGGAAYIIATTTGIMRVVNNRHWCSDVLAGAGIGILSARVGYWLLPWEKRVWQRLFNSQTSCHNKKSPTNLIMLPSYDEQQKALAFNLAVVL